MSRSRPITPFVPPRPGAAPPVVPTAAAAPPAVESDRVVPPNPYAGYSAHAETPGWGATQPNPYAAYPQPQAQYRTPYRADGVPPGPAYDPGTSTPTG